MSNLAEIELDFEKFYSVPMKCLKINGGYPFYERNTKWFLHCFGIQGTFTVFFLGLIYQSKHYDLKNNDMLAVCANGTLMVIYVVISVMLFDMVNYKSTFCELINFVKADYEYAKAKLSSDDQKVVLEYALMGQAVGIHWAYLVIFGALVFPAQSIVLTLYYTITDEFRIVDMFPFKYPERMEELMGPAGKSILSNAELFIFLMCSVSGYVGTVPLGPAFMLHACGKIGLVERRVNLLFPKDGSTLLETRRKTIEIVKQIQDIYSFVEKIQTAFEVLYEITLKGSSLILPLMIFMILESLKQGQLPVEFITISLGAVVLSSIPCYYSDMLQEKGEVLRQAIYSSSWEKSWDKSARSSIYIILTRFSRPIVLKTMFRNICLDALADVFRDAYSLFNLLHATV